MAANDYNYLNDLFTDEVKPLLRWHGGLVDSSLTKDGIAADAKVTGETFNVLKETIGDRDKTVEVGALIDGEYINTVGNAATSSIFARTDYVAFPYGAIDVEITCSIIDSASFAIYGADKGLLLCVNKSNAGEYGVASSGTPQNLHFTLPDGAAYFRASYYKSKYESLEGLSATVRVGGKIVDDLLATRKKVSEIEGTFTPTASFGNPETVAGKYITLAGTEGSFASFSHTKPVYIPAGYKLKVGCAMSGATALSVISKYDPTTGAYKSLVGWKDGENEYEYVVSVPTYIVISFYTSNGYNVDLVRDYHTLAQYASETAKNDVPILMAFNEIVCIGDSLTYSQVYTSANGSRQAYQTYPDVVKKRTGTPTSMFARAGATPNTWWDEFHSECFVARTNACYIVYLGTNAGLTDTIDADCPASESMTAWADTNTGYYGRILQSISDLGAKAILVKVYATGGDLDITNNVIEKFGERFGFPVVENEKLGDVYHLYPNKSGANSVHYNDLGYAAFADQLLKNVGSLAPEKLALLIPN